MPLPDYDPEMGPPKVDMNDWWCLAEQEARKMRIRDFLDPIPDVSEMLKHHPAKSSEEAVKAAHFIDQASEDLRSVMGEPRFCAMATSKGAEFSAWDHFHWDRLEEYVAKKYPDISKPGIRVLVWNVVFWSYMK
jgi:hypothetical protein